MSILVIIAILFFLLALYLLYTGAVIGGVIAACLGLLILLAQNGRLRT